MDLKPVLTPPKTIAVVGLSDKPERSSYQVAHYLLDHGFTIIPVNPMVSEVFGLRAYSSVSTIPSEIPIDIVDIFRRSEEVPVIVTEVLQTQRKPLIWMQENVISPEAKQLAESNGLPVIMNSCMMKMHAQLF